MCSSPLYISFLSISIVLTWSQILSDIVIGILVCFLFHVCFVCWLLSDDFHFVNIFTGKMFFLNRAGNLIVLFDYSLPVYVLFCCWCGSGRDGSGSAASAIGGCSYVCVCMCLCVYKNVSVCECMLCVYICEVRDWIGPGMRHFMQLDMTLDYLLSTSQILGL